MIEDPKIELFDVDKENAQAQNMLICLERNGFLLCRRGYIVLKIDDKTFTVKAGDLYIYTAFSQTYVEDFSDDLEGIAGTADFDFVLSSLESISNTQSHVYIRFHPCVTLSPEQFKRIEQLALSIRMRKDIESPLSLSIVSALVAAFCYEIVDAFISNTPVPLVQQTRKDKMFQKFLIALYQNYSTHRDVKFYADLLNLTPRYFSTLIRQVSGRTPIDWISLFVVIEAKRLLSNPNISIKEVANRLNFSEQSFFGRYFKQYTGYSPSEYKSQTIPKNE
ncbi:MAG: helix-turn-helix domain-containing protein [Candidatus Limisoma sp.]